MMNEIHKEFTWDMGHRITKHGGKCYNLHGHTYKAVVWVSDSGLNSMGMVLDFYDLTQVMNPIVEELDHAFMLYDNDVVMRSFFDIVSIYQDLEESSVSVNDSYDLYIPEKMFKVKIVPFESTAENIAKYIFERVREKIPNVSKVEVYETPKSVAVYTPDTFNDTLVFSKIGKDDSAIS
jgi:6-pyruvoyltetrahydropterin/6-carboxytetrahydropterin synthase